MGTVVPKEKVVRKGERREGFLVKNISVLRIGKK